ncbi:hypothetical protein [Actomonas aquatica]|uniref:Uncharacterized protein n=1 Tax=Actomonas aquatica TaxID=2866162 RepID=A0ABZ1C3Q8_9BACT|nr:hypothetical protein [Opitutus sp. WL0086]WRQ85987.1 hypothetical protein K1X11_014330 [Opitutus sp. WL0086]
MLLAYLDPGTGSIILQAVIAGFMGALFVVKLFWAKLKGGFKAVFSRSSSSTDDNAAQD